MRFYRISEVTYESGTKEYFVQQLTWTGWKILVPSFSTGRYKNIEDAAKYLNKLKAKKYRNIYNYGKFLTDSTSSSE